MSFPVLTFGAATVTLAKASENILRVALRAMQRSTLGNLLRDKMTNRWILQARRKPLEKRPFYQIVVDPIVSIEQLINIVLGCSVK